MHFTYCDAGGDLKQGDILRKTSELAVVLKRFHPYYLKEDYKHFIVLTQSCDLVCREGLPTSPYLTLAAVRPLAVVLRREARKYQKNPILQQAEAVTLRNREILHRFIDHLLNNNAPEYFYLHADTGVGITEHSCAFLRLSVALRMEHYETCRAARIICLQPTFQSKLGWLVGNIFSRVGTEDWVPGTKTKTEWREFVDKILDEHLVFVDDRKLEWTKKNVPSRDLESKSADEVRQIISSAPQWKKKDDVINAVVEHLEEHLERDGPVQLTDLTRLRTRLINSSKLKSLLG